MQTLVAAKYKDIKGVPLSIVASGDNPDTGKNEVVLEDPEGVTFSVPREWIVGHDIEHAQDEFLDHTKISGAPAGELKRIWQEATNSQAPGGGYGDVPTVLDAWSGWHDKDNNPTSETGGSQRGKGGSGAGGSWTDSDEAAFIDARDGNGDGKLTSIPPWHPTVAKSQLVRRNPSGAIPADAGAGWGNPGQVWNPRTQLWENRK
jgi:hypothetical protein